MIYIVYSLQMKSLIHRSIKLVICGRCNMECHSLLSVDIQTIRSCVRSVAPFKCYIKNWKIYIHLHICLYAARRPLIRNEFSRYFNHEIQTYMYTSINSRDRRSHARRNNSSSLYSRSPVIKTARLN